MNTELVLCDTNILIAALRGDFKTIEILTQKITQQNIVISTITYMELCRGSLNKTHLNKLTKELKGYNILHIDESISIKAMELIKDYHLSHNLQIPDAIIAAASLEYKLPIFTFNLKDFKYIKGIKLFKP